MSYSRLAASVGLTAAIGLAVATAVSPANADLAPRADDVVGIGSDIMQNGVNFLADGVTLDGTFQTGYNAANNPFRLISYDATADQNGRNAFTDPALSTPTALNPTIVLQAGTSPIQRPNGGGAAINALVADGVSGNPSVGGLIDFVRSPNLPSDTQQSAASNNLGTSIHSVKIAQDSQYIASATTTNAPSVITAAQLVQIYTCSATTWGQIGVTGPAAGETIVPLIPQAGAGVRTIFLNALKAANSNVAVTPGSCVTAVQQNDPSTITNLSAAQKPNAIVPFPKGRYDLLNKGWFHDPNVVYSAASPAAPLSAAGITLHTGASAFVASIPYYILFRTSDANSTTGWQPGSNLNWVQTLFFNDNYDSQNPDPAGPPAPWVASEAGQAVLASMGLDPVYVDCDTSTTSCS